jgi:hypothetical protein
MHSKKQTAWLLKTCLARQSDGGKDRDETQRQGDHPGASLMRTWKEGDCREGSFPEPRGRGSSSGGGSCKVGSHYLEAGEVPGICQLPCLGPCTLAGNPSVGFCKCNLGAGHTIHLLRLPMATFLMVLRLVMRVTSFPTCSQPPPTHSLQTLPANSENSLLPFPLCLLHGLF